jgi:pimeloyl-ACP methyl ester carboxylesterase
MKDTQMRNSAGFGRLILMSLVAVPTTLSIGCMQPLPDRAERMTRGYIYYFDGAGGGGVIANWAGGVRQGLLNAGYNGSGEVFNWNTGMGVGADQDATVEYKKSKAAECARKIQEYVRSHPGAPVTLMGLSAGTAVAVYTLEALPQNCPVENVILLGASISASHDLTQALQRVRNRMYVFTSEHDAVLAFLVPMAGTADREQGVPSAGLSGFRMPARATAETRTQYAKVAYVGWKPEFEREGNFGGHTDTVKAPFVQRYIAPLIMASLARRSTVASAGGKVRNPDYERWANFAPGSSVTFAGYQLIDGAKQLTRMTVRLVSKHEDRLVIERTYVPVGGGDNIASRVQQFFVEAMITPADHPLTSPGTKILESPTETLTISGKSFPCRVRTIQVEGDFPEYGRGVWASLGQNDTLPGGMAKVWLKSTKGGRPFEFRGQVEEYRIR